MGRRLSLCPRPWGNSAADSAAKDALVGDISVEHPLSDLKPRTNTYVLDLWQSECDEFPENKLHKIFPDLIQGIICPRTNRKEKIGLARLHIDHSFITHSFLLKGEEPPMGVECDEFLTIKYIFFLLVQISLKKERAIIQLSQYEFYLKKSQWKRFLSIWKQ